MGLYLIDKYSIIHFFSGIIAYNIGMNLYIYILFHIIFEYLENTDFGIHFINKYLISFWIGGKESSDSLINRFGDVIFGVIGWLVAYYYNK